MGKANTALQFRKASLPTSVRFSLLALVAALVLFISVSQTAVAAESATDESAQTSVVSQEEPATTEESGTDRESVQIALAVAVLFGVTGIGLVFGLYGLREK